jgi:hypothetical protein
MKIGDLVKVRRIDENWSYDEVGPGIIIGFDGCEPIVFWNEKFPNELEYIDQLEVVSESQ